MEEWEGQIIPADKLPEKNALDMFGEHGWQLVTIVPTDDYLRYEKGVRYAIYLQRRKVRTSPVRAEGSEELAGYLREIRRWLDIAEAARTSHAQFEALVEAMTITNNAIDELREEQEK